MTPNTKLRNEVLKALAKESHLDESQIGVNVKNGIVTLSGYVSSFPQKYAAEKATEKVKGVKAIVEKIQILSSSIASVTDAQIAEDLVEAFRKSNLVPADKIKVKVEKGWLYIDGEVNWQFQMDALNRIAKAAAGVKKIVNRVSLSSQVSSPDLQHKFIEALKKSKRVNAEKIFVEAENHEIRLKGEVRTWAEKEYAKRLVFDPSGNWKVINELKVG